MQPGEPETCPGRSRAASPDWVRTAADCALDAMVVAAATVILAHRQPSSAARMALLAGARRSGLLCPPPHRDLLAELDVVLGRLRAAPAEQRRMLVATMNMMVGSDAAPSIAQVATDIAQASGPSNPATRAALRAIRAALGLPGRP